MGRMTHEKWERTWWYGRNPRRYGKAKLRMVAIAQILAKFTHTSFLPNFNAEACLLIEEYGKKHGYKFQHALNGGEYYIKDLGYWVDGYDKKNNVVIEIDEDYHFDDRGKLKTEDRFRQRQIEQLLGCKFIRLKI
jgi:hypothetical protein